ncbi:uncharacterized protein LOC117173636 [Belonocnema kinseyi]|uniref:uncharacterized protein LOC117173636 n=1 Tax=Belonocnema kinseyi TaxID=2817044 RepID=UPI00143DF713|nr:uncharacterized protein LOC117173636 [Belonocnema kinseyi]
MANIGGPKPSRRRLLMSVTHSILLCAAEVWADALRIKKYRKRMAALQRRGAQNVARAYRTVSEPATLVIVGVIPIDLLAAERKRESRVQTMQQWQARCSHTPHQFMGKTRSWRSELLCHTNALWAWIVSGLPVQNGQNQKSRLYILRQ